MTYFWGGAGVRLFAGYHYCNAPKIFLARARKKQILDGGEDKLFGDLFFAESTQLCELRRFRMVLGCFVFKNRVSRGSICFGEESGCLWEPMKIQGGILFRGHYCGVTLRIN